MRKIFIYTITSPLHDTFSIESQSKIFLDSLGIDYTPKGEDFNDFGDSAESDLRIIFIRTGGTEELFLSKLQQIKKSKTPIYLLTWNKNNSLAASMEILSYLNQNGIKGEIIHGDSESVCNRISEICLEETHSATETTSALATENCIFDCDKFRSKLCGSRLGVIGKPSNWLISSNVNYNVVKENFGAELIDVPMEELLKRVEIVKDYEEVVEELKSGSFTSNCKNVNAVKNSFEGAAKIYAALKQMIVEKGFDGVTVRCFDLLTSVKNTGCIALSKLNSEGYIAGCEGDIPTALSMLVARKLLGVSGFQANPSYVDLSKGEVMFAHCTIPVSMVDSYQLDSHFESGIGVAIRGFMKNGEVTIFKVSGDFSRCFIEQGILLENGSSPDLCRTQQLIRLTNPNAAKYFLTNPIGNHHIILHGHCKEKLLI